MNRGSKKDALRMVVPSTAVPLLPAGLLPAMFGFSGATALIYEVTWSRTLQFIFGSTIQTTSTIFAGFLLGFSLGAALFRGLAETTSRPLRHMGMIELAIGIYGFSLPAILAGARLAHAALPDLPVFRLGLCFAIVLVPTTLFGGLWPYVGRCGLRVAQRVGTDAAQIYSANSLGSAAGAFASGFILIPWLGLTHTSWVAALLNLTLAAALLRQKEPAQ